MVSQVPVARLHTGGCQMPPRRTGRLEALGALVREPLQDVGEGIRVAAVADPFGNTFGLIENPHFSAEKVR